MSCTTRVEVPRLAPYPFRTSARRRRLSKTRSFGFFHRIRRLWNHHATALITIDTFFQPPPHTLSSRTHPSSWYQKPSAYTMISLRHLTRSAPRAFTRLARQPAVRPSTLLKGASVTVAARTRQPLAAAAFSSSSASRKAASVGETDDELSAKLESEIQIEEDMKAEEQESASVKDFLENSPFELIDTPGQEVVKLVRSFGEERYVSSPCRPPPPSGELRTLAVHSPVPRE